MLDEVIEAFVLTKGNKLFPGELIKYINGYEHLYQITSFGRVWSIDRQIWMRPNIDKDGYHLICLCKDKKHKVFKIHRLVLTAFRREPNKNEQARHLDGSKSNNHINNLEWGTQSDNEQDKYLHGTDSHKGEKNGSSKLTNEKVLNIRELYKIGKYSKHDLAKIYNVSSGTIHLIVTNKSWRHI